MYLGHYHLELSPFEIGPDPRFLWLGEKHNEAFAVLRYGILEHKGFITLLGAPGTGKSTLLNALGEAFGANVRFAKISDPAMSAQDFFNVVAHAFGMDRSFETKADFVIHFQRFLEDAGTRSTKVVLVVDEAQRLSDELLDQIRVMANIAPQSGIGLSCILAGQEEFLSLLERNRAFSQRVFFSHVLKPLSRAETGHYIAHRLQVAGARRPIFSDAAVDRVFHWSQGNPRLINIICDQTLLGGYSTGAETVGPELVDESIGSTLIPLDGVHRARAGSPAPPQEATAPLGGDSPDAAPEPPPPTASAVPPRTPVRAVYWVPALAGILLGGLGVYWFSGAGGTDPAAPVAVARETELRHLQDQLAELSRQKQEAEQRVKGYQAKLESLEKGQQEADSARVRMAELEAGLTSRTQDMSTLDRKLKELEASLSAEKNEKARLDAEVAARDAAMEELRRRVESAVASQDELRTANARLTDELKQAKAGGERAAQLESAVREREQKTVQLETTLRELEKELYQERITRGGLAAELSSREAAVEALKKNIELLKANSAHLEAAAKAPVPAPPASAAPSPPSPAPAPAGPPAPKVQPAQPGGSAPEAPDPTGIIDFVLRKKTQ